MPGSRFAIGDLLLFDNYIPANTHIFKERVNSLN